MPDTPDFLLEWIQRCPERRVLIQDRCKVGVYVVLPVHRNVDGFVGHVVGVFGELAVCGIRDGVYPGQRAARILVK